MSAAAVNTAVGVVNAHMMISQLRNAIPSQFTRRDALLWCFDNIEQL